MNILITGGTGFIGSALCSRLLEDQHHLVVLSRHPETIQSPVQGIGSLAHLTDDMVFDALGDHKASHGADGGKIIAGRKENPA